LIHNKMSDALSAEELEHHRQTNPTMRGFSANGPVSPVSPGQYEPPIVQHSSNQHGEPPAVLDWINISTPVKNQNQCGSCYAFATTEVIESAYWKKHGFSVVLSPQQIVSCTVSSMSGGSWDGCNGGVPLQVMNYLAQGNTEYTTCDACRGETFQIWPANSFVLGDAGIMTSADCQVTCDSLGDRCDGYLMSGSRCYSATFQPGLPRGFGQFTMGCQGDPQIPPGTWTGAVKTIKLQELAGDSSQLCQAPAGAIPPSTRPLGLEIGYPYGQGGWPSYGPAPSTALQCVSDRVNPIWAGNSPQGPFNINRGIGSFTYTQEMGPTAQVANSVTIKGLTGPNGVLPADNILTVRTNSDALFAANRMIMSALATHGPLTITVNATALNGYTGGVLTNERCASNGNDHAVVLVGYDSRPSNPIPYWLVRNSWGPIWGENGYFRMSMAGNTCGFMNFIVGVTVA